MGEISEVPSARDQTRSRVIQPAVVNLLLGHHVSDHNGVEGCGGYLTMLNIWLGSALPIGQRGNMR